MDKYLTIDECKDRGLYRISSRNLTFGVYRADCKGFIGIREKFYHLYLFTEYHYDTGAPFGTVFPREFLEDCPIEDVRENGDSFDEITNRPVAFDKPVSSGGKGWYFLDTGEASAAIRATSKINQALFDWLTEKEKQHAH